MNSRKSNYCLRTSLHKWMKISLLSSLLIIGFVDQSIAQEPRKTQKITGTVTNSEKSPLTGAAIKIKSRTTGTTTDENGNFVINASLTDTLIVTYINYITQTVRINNRTSIPIILVDAANNLNEVIVIGYGNVKKKEFSGVVGKVNMEDVKKAPVTSFDQALAGRIAGVTVSTNDGQPGGGSQIVVRGGTAGQETSPLYVIDGFPIENMDINSINTNDIESIEVLKDASSIAIYGSRGANGVIMITTKKGKAEPTRVTYSFSDGIQKVTKKMDMMSPYEFVKLQLELDSIQSTAATKVVTGANRYINTADGIDLDYYKSVKPYNWQDMLIRTGNLQTHNIGVSGGNKDTRFGFNGGYTDQTGIIINTGLRKYDGKFTLDTKLSDNLKVGASLNYANTQSYGTIPTAGTSGGVTFNMWAFRPVDVLGASSLETGFIDSSLSSTSTAVPDNLVNPKQQALNEYRKNITATTTLNTYLEYTLTPELKFRVTGGISNTKLTSEAFYNSKTSQGTLAVNSNGVLFNPINQINGAITNNNNTNYLTESTLSYRKRFNKDHIIDAVAGFSYQYGRADGNGYGSIQIPQALEYLGIGSLGSGTATKISLSPTHNRMYSSLGRVNYSLFEKYIFTVTGRQDGSSRFAAGHQWSFFPSGAFAWRFTEENFVRKLNAKFKNKLTEGKLRISYGNVGNNRVSDQASRYQLGFSTAYGYPIGGVNTPGLIPFFYGNPILTWETSKELDLGTSLSFMKDRILIDVDYYLKNTTNSLLAVPLPGIAGYANGTNSQYQNAGTIRNRGLEFTITTTNIQKKNFSWTSSFNISFNKNKVISFYGSSDVRQTSWNTISTAPTAWVAKVGYPMTQFYGYKWGGVYQYADFNKLSNGNYVLKPGIASYGTTANSVQPGDPKYKDLNGDGVIDDNDRTIIGTPLAIHTGGFSNNFTYKSFSLGIFFQWSYGNEVLNMNKFIFNTSGNYYANSNQFAEYANRWTPNNPTNDIPRANARTGGADLDGKVRLSSRLVEDASFLRFKTVSFGYNLPEKWIKKASIKSARVFVSAQNLFTWTKYSGLDPEVSTYRGANPANVPSGVSGGNATAGVGYLYIQPSSGSAALAQGLDYTPYPRYRTITIGANVVF